MREVDSRWHISCYHVKMVNLHLTYRLYMFFFCGAGWLCCCLLIFQVVILFILAFVTSVGHYSFSYYIKRVLTPSKIYSFVHIQKSMIFVPDVISWETTLIWSDLLVFKILNGIRLFWTVLLLFIIYFTMIKLNDFMQFLFLLASNFSCAKGDIKIKETS